MNYKYTWDLYNIHTCNTLLLFVLLCYYYCTIIVRYLCNIYLFWFLYYSSSIMYIMYYLIFSCIYSLLYVVAVYQGWYTKKWVSKQFKQKIKYSCPAQIERAQIRRHQTTKIQGIDRRHANDSSRAVQTRWDVSFCVRALRVQGML